VARATARDQPRQRGPRQAREREIDDVGVGKQIVEEGFDRRERVRPAQLKNDDGNRLLVQARTSFGPGRMRIARHRGRSIQTQSVIGHFAGGPRGLILARAGWGREENASRAPSLREGPATRRAYTCSLGYGERGCRRAQAGRAGELHFTK